MLRKLWHDPVWSKVIAAAIMALAGTVWVAYRQNWLPAVWNGITVACVYLLGTAQIHRWVLGLYMLGTGLFVLLFIGISIIAWQAKKQSQESPDWLAYTSDIFFGLKWVWGYEGKRVVLKAAVCPNCDYELAPDSTSTFSSRVCFHCDSCRRTIPVEGHSWQTLQGVVERLIHQKLRAANYPRVVLGRK